MRSTVARLIGSSPREGPVAPPGTLNYSKIDRRCRVASLRNAGS